MGKVRSLVYLKVLAPILFVVLAVGFLACGGGGPEGTTGEEEGEVRPETLAERDARMA